MEKISNLEKKLKSKTGRAVEWVLSVAVVGVGIYLNNYWVIALGAAAVLSTVFRPGEKILSFVNVSKRPK